jgi:galactokinase
VRQTAAVRSQTARVAAFAPGRVNLIGDHTDHAGGRALPMAIQLGTTVRLAVGGEVVRLESSVEGSPAVVPLGIDEPAIAALPPWARYVGAVVREVRPARGGTGTVTTTLPVGAGLSSSAALELAVALATGYEGPPRALAALGQRAEHVASGVPCGIMDQLTSALGRDGHALLIDFTTLDVMPVPVPPQVSVVVVDSGDARRLAGSAYARRRAECDAAVAEVGPLAAATIADVDAIPDPTVRRRARHVVTENARVLDFAAALERGDLVGAGDLMRESHRSLRDDFEVSTTALDDLVDRLAAMPGVFGARLTGAGFGGCAVALCEPGALDLGWTVRASAGARRLPVDGDDDDA